MACDALFAVAGPSAAAAISISSANHERRARAVAEGRLNEGRHHHLSASPDLALGRLSWAATDGLWVAADAALYYREELRSALRAAGVDVATDGSPASLVLAAYRAWGTGMAARLEGDFALLLWDGPRRLLVAARDFVGRRPLYIATLTDGGVAVGSQLSTLLDLPGCPNTLAPAALAGVAAGLPESPWDTVYEAVRVLPAGHTLIATINADGRLDSSALERHWTPPTFERGGGAPFGEAADELNALLRAAVRERMDDVAPTAVWLSGGWDSTTIYGAGKAEIRRGAVAGQLSAVSMSYPAGDPGRENELIEQVTGFWGDSTHWCDSSPIPLFGDVRADAAERELPFAHPYELWTRSLAATTRAAGCRVALDGSGGDQLYQLSPIYLADLVGRGRWLAARREWRARDMTGLGWRRFARYAVLPLLPPSALRLIAAMRGGRPVNGIRTWPLPPWIRRDFALAHDLAERAGSRLPRRPGERHGAHETRWFFESSYSPTVLAVQSADARRAGVELRSPLFDSRVVHHASLRPREERSDRGQTKRLLRAAARGLLPEEILAPRGSRTGTTTGYYRQRLLAELPALSRIVLPMSALADLGIVEPVAFSDAVQRSLQGGVEEFDVALFYTIQTELWLRAHG